ncbi:MAG: ribonuclease H-like domain-containing protein [Blastocatellia bacterium]
MLKNTFCHIPGITPLAEQRLWASGIDCWDAALEAGPLKLSRCAPAALCEHLRASLAHLEKSNPHHFVAALKANQHWRLFPEFRHTLAYLDIETTGLGYGDSITTIVIYDGRRLRHYVQGDNLKDFKRDIAEYSTVVTYNGKSFDVPFIERYFRIRMPHAHIDLMYVLRSLGYKGGLKGCERQLGLDRKELADVDGFFAVLLWNEFKRTRDPRALETLLAYNATDVVNLEALLVKAYNMKLNETPFYNTHRIAAPTPPQIPFKADHDTIQRLRHNTTFSYYGWR